MEHLSAVFFYFHAQDRMRRRELKQLLHPPYAQIRAQVLQLQKESGIAERNVVAPYDGLLRVLYSDAADRRRDACREIVGLRLLKVDSDDLARYTFLHSLLQRIDALGFPQVFRTSTALRDYEAYLRSLVQPTPTELRAAYLRG
jgi:hypothetical protein